MKDDLKNLKYWLDAEITILHIFLWAILGVLIGGWFWWIAGIFMAVSLFYAIKKILKLPKDFLK